MAQPILNYKHVRTAGFRVSSENKQTKSKCFAFVPIIREPNQNLLLRSISFLLHRNVPLRLQQFLDQIKIGSLRPRTYGPKRKRTAFDTKKFGPNQNVLLPFRS